MLPSYYTNKIQNAIIQYANNGVGLYNALVDIHEEARTAGDSVIYPTNATLKITIPSSPQTISLSPNTDFNFCRFEVKNTTNQIVNLFSLVSNGNDVHSVTIDKFLLKKDAMVYGSEQELTITPKLIIVEDQEPWSYRVGYSDPVKRKDVFFVIGNQIQNDPIATYDTDESLPSCHYVDVSTIQKTFKNIVFERTSDSTAVTNLLSVQKQYNVLIENVSIITPDQGEPGTGVTPIHEDACINIHDSAKIEMSNISINYTYASIYYYGYGIRLLNVWDSYISHLTAYNPRRGVMGNENVNGLVVEDSVLNRVDVHCYGRDITCTNCTFKNTSNNWHIYNRVSSFYGKLIYANCTFDYFLPLRIDSDYNAFTPFDLILDNCTLNVATNHKSIVDLDTLVDQTNNRSELTEKCLPNIEIRNLHLTIPSSETDFYFIRIYNYDYLGSIHHMNTFLVDVIEFAAPSNINIYDFGYTVSNHPECNNNPLSLVEPLRRNMNMNHRIVGGS